MKKILFIAFMSVAVFLSAATIAVNAGDISVQLQIPIPGLAQSLPVCTTKSTGLECTGIAQYIAYFYRWLVGIAAVLAVLALTWGGVRWLTSAGDTSAIGDAKKIMGNAIVGLAVAFCSYTLLWAINPELVQFTPLRIQPIQEIPLDFESVEKHGEETGDKVEDGEPEFEDPDEVDTSLYFQSLFAHMRFLFEAMPVYAAAKTVNAGKGSGKLKNIETYITNNTQWGIPSSHCLKWTRLALESIFGTKRIQKTPLYPTQLTPNLIAKQFDAKGTYIRSSALSGIKNADVVFMRTADSALVREDKDNGPGGDSISHIGVYYNGHIYHQFGSRLSKDVAESGVLKGRKSAKGKPVEIISYGRMGF